MKTYTNEQRTSGERGGRRPRRSVSRNNMDQDIPAKQFMQPTYLSFHEQVIDKIVDFADIWRLVLPPHFFYLIV